MQLINPHVFEGFLLTVVVPLVVSSFKFGEKSKHTYLLIMTSKQKFPIQEVINDLIDTDKSPNSALLKLNLFGMLTKNEGLIKFTKNEMEGYGSDHESIPKYRKAKPTYFVELQDEYGRPDTIEIPVFALAEPYNQLMQEIPIKEGIGSIELMKSDYNKQPDSTGLIKIPISMMMLPTFQDAVNKIVRSNFDTNVTKVWAYYSIYKGQEILDTVRSQLLSFVVEVADTFGYDIEIETYKQNQSINNQTINNIMNTNITNTGDGNIVNTGDKAILNVNVTIAKNDLEKLKEVLLNNGIEEPDVEEISEIVKAEQPDSEKKTLGTRAIKWISKITGKALSGVGKIATSVTSAVLAEYIKQYYGLDNKSLNR